MGKKEILDNLVPEHIKVVVGKKSYKIGGLSIIQTIQLLKEAMRVLVRLGTEDLAKLQQGETNLEDLISFFEFLTEDEAIKVVGIFLDEKDEAFLRQNLNLVVTTEVLAAVCERNDFGKILKNVQRMVRAVQKKIS